MTEAIKFTILGQSYSKANSRKIVTFGNRPAVIKSQKARCFEQSALMQIPEHAKQMIDRPVAVTMNIFYASNRPDLDESVILDVLQARFKGSGKERVCVRRGVYVNDRLVKEKHIYHGIDKLNPRAEIEVRLI